MRLLFLSFLISIAWCEMKELPPCYQGIELLPFYDPCEHPEFHDRRYKQFFMDHKIETVIEVGSWLGNSARVFAARIPENGKVYAVDHWLGSEEQQPDPILPRLYQQFLSNIIHSGYAHKIIPVKMASLDAAKYLSDVKPDLVYIDASHKKEDVLEDLRAWYPYVKGRDAIFCGDDWTCKEVEEAVRIFAQEEGLTILLPSHNFYRLIK
jgi:hypothetical protein